MKIKPLDARVLVQLEGPRTAKVVAVGTAWTLRRRVQAGDLILFGEYSGDEFELEGKKYLMLQRSEILAILRQGLFDL